MTARRQTGPVPPGPVVCNGTALRAASRRVSQLYDEQLAPAGIRGTQYALLHRIDLRDRASLNDLARDMAMDRSTLGHNLRPLERDGFVTLGVDPDDRRTRTISLSAAGKKKLAQARPLWAKAHARFETVFGAPRARKLRALLGEIASDEFVAAFGGI